MKNSRADIDTIVEQIVEQFSPQQILLFGSQAYGQPTKESDVDLLVILETEESPLHAAAQISAAIEHPIPLDIVVRTPETFAAQLSDRSFFESQIQRDGISLYEAPDRGVDSKGRGRLANRAAREEL